MAVVKTNMVMLVKNPWLAKLCKCSELLLASRHVIYYLFVGICCIKMNETNETGIISTT